MMRRLLEPLAAAEVLGHAAYAPASGDAASPRDPRRELARRVPGHRIPARWLALERLPRNGSGKLVRKSVRDTFTGIRRHGPPATRSAASV
jgi:acyl-coenzyme A synthetase/AMP-(fatty) acid ligase